MSSKKQIEANRRNASLSTGPRTAAGKARSSLNAVKHGAYSQHLLLTPDEEAADLSRFERMYLAHYLPRTELENDQVQTLAALAWRLRRCARMEAEILGAHGYEDQDKESSEKFEYGGAGWGFTHDCSKFKAVVALSQVEARTFRRFWALKKDLDVKLARPIPAGEPGRVDGGGSSLVEPAHDG